MRINYTATEKLKINIGDIVNYRERACLICVDYESATSLPIKLIDLVTSEIVAEGSTLDTLNMDKFLKLLAKADEIELNI